MFLEKLSKCSQVTQLTFRKRKLRVIRIEFTGYTNLSKFVSRRITMFCFNQTNQPAQFSSNVSRDGTVFRNLRFAKFWDVQVAIMVRGFTLVVSNLAYMYMVSSRLVTNFTTMSDIDIFIHRYPHCTKQTGTFDSIKQRS